MSWIRLALIAALIVAASNAPAQFTTLGAGGKSGGGSIIVGCAGTGFDFTLPCNSQYLAVF